VRAPEFWRNGFGRGPALLAPLALAYRSAGAMRRALTRPWRAPVPVICVGGLVAGGSGKTPVALAIGGSLTRQGQTPHFLSRGYGGRLGRRGRKPVRVDPAQHSAAEVGDEALLLAAEAPTWVARDRRAAARAAVAAGATVLVMDDGYQNPALVKTLSVIVVDGTYGFGNRRVIPAGPLREPLHQGLARADAVVLVGENLSGVTAVFRIRLPVLRAHLVPGPEAAGLAGHDVVAFAGIGIPDKFFHTLETIGCRVIARHPLPDHHRYTQSEVARFLAEAESQEAVAVTTAKDALRIPDEMAAQVEVLTVTLEWTDETRLVDLLQRAFD